MEGADSTRAWVALCCTVSVKSLALLEVVKSGGARIPGYCFLLTISSSYINPSNPPLTAVMEFEGCVAVAAGRPTTHDSSHAVKKPKPKPKTRIVHVFPPEIIKTDAANFRELVQRLTGKPVTRASSNRRRKNKDEAGCVGLEGEVAPSCKQVGLWRGMQELGNGGGATVKLEEKDSGGFSWEFGEIESFLHELSDVSLLPSSTSPVNYI
ncbi:hypothetical protein BHE74_00033240 [Ensete ventricosum]|nr:hypothetical protein BHE74_00033240 [Ensete ventricosum]